MFSILSIGFAKCNQGLGRSGETFFLKRKGNEMKAKMKTLDELKPVRCGCGGEAIIGLKKWGDFKGNYHENSYVYCNDCSISTVGYLTEAEAIEAWNRAMGAYQFRDLTKKIERTAKVNVNYRDESVVFGFCECGQAVNTYSTYCPHCGARLEWDE